MSKRKKAIVQSNIGKDARSFGGILKELICDIYNDDVGLYAAQSTFFIVLSAVPFTMLLILCLKYFVNLDLAEVIKSFERLLPKEISQFLIQIISEVFERSQSTALFSATVLTLLWSSSKGTMAIYCGLNKIYGYTKTTNWFRMRIMSLFYNVLMVVLIIASIVVLVFGNAIMSFVDAEYILAHYMISVLMRFRTIIFFTVFALVFAALFAFLPQKKNKYRGQLWGAAITSAGWLSISYGFAVYIKFFPRVSYIYGSLTALMLLMLWMFFCIYILLIGAEINKHIENGYFRRLGMRILRRKVKRVKKRKKK